MKRDKTMSHWKYNGYPFTTDHIGNNAGFVYVITDMNTGERYIGKKFFFERRTLPPLKGKTRKRKVTRESNWKDYTSSSKQVNECIKSGHVMDYKILNVYPDRREVNYGELRWQILLDVLDTKNNFMNGNISRVFYKSRKYDQFRQMDLQKMVDYVTGEK